jgi:hypothetical protein
VAEESVEFSFITVAHNVSTTGELFPEDAPKAYAYNGSNQLTSVTATYDGKTYVKTLTYTDDNLTAESGWVKQ